jgi:hypothetical protein
MRLQVGLGQFEAQLLVVPASHHRPVDRPDPVVALEDHPGDLGERIRHHHYQVADPSDSVLPEVNDFRV